MIDFKELAADIFATIKTYDSDIILYDQLGNRVFDALESTRIYSQGLRVLVTVDDAGENSNVVFNCTDSNQVTKLETLIKTIRGICNSANVIFSVKLIKDVVTPDKLAPVTESLLEGMYGTSSSSYIKLPNAKVIIRHTKPVREGQLGSRGKNIRAIFVEDASGTRIEFTPRVLLGARALASHVNQGGLFGDAISAQITRMAADYQNLQSSITSLSSSPESVMPNGVHVSVAVSEGIASIRNALKSMVFGKYESAVGNLSQLVESNSSIVDYIKIDLSENILDSIKRNTTMKVTEKDAYGEYNANRDIVNPDGSHESDASGDVSESLLESLREFDNWLDATTTLPKEELVVADDVVEPVEPVEPVQLAELEPEVQPAVDEDQLAAIAKIAAIDMAQDALRDVLSTHAPKFATTPAHEVVSKHIVPAILASVEERKLAYDSLVSAVNKAANGGDLGELMKLLDITASIEGYSDFADFTFNAAISDVLGSDAPEGVEQPVEVLAPVDTEVEPDGAAEPVDVSDADAVEVVEPVEVITKSVVNEIETSVGVGPSKLNKATFTNYLEWAKAKEVIADDALKLSGTSTIDGESQLVAKWDVITESGWVMVPVLEEDEDVDPVCEEIASVLVAGKYTGGNYDVFRDTAAYVNSYPFYKAVLNATRGYTATLEEYLDKAARKLGSGSFVDYAEKYKADIDAKEANVIVGTFN